MVARNRENQTADEKDFSKEEKKSALTEKNHSEELDGKLRKDNRDDKLLHSKINVDKDLIDKARVLTDAINNNISSFAPDLSFEQLVNNYSSAKKIMGETLIRELTGYEPGYVEKNINIPEFRRELKESIKQNTNKLKEDKLLDKEGFITEKAYEFAVLSMLSDELDELEGKGFLGEKESKKKSPYGIRYETKNYSRGDKYRDIELKKSTKKALRRGHSKLMREDLVASERKAKGKINIIYAIDSSGSMKGDKIKAAKKAGMALAYKAIKNNDDAGLIIFGSKIIKTIEPGKDFYTLAKTLFNIRTTGETDIGLCIEHAIPLFKRRKETNHIVLITDALQTKGKKPESLVLEKVSAAANLGITISVVGININDKGEKLAKKIANISKGSLFNVRSLDNMDSIVLEDYYRVK